MEEDFVLEPEKEKFVEVLRAIVKKAPEILSTQSKVWLLFLTFVIHTSTAMFCFLISSVANGSKRLYGEILGKASAIMAINK